MAANRENRIAVGILAGIVISVFLWDILTTSGLIYDHWRMNGRVATGRFLNVAIELSIVVILAGVYLRSLFKSKGP
jgi:hypothetical protein